MKTEIRQVCLYLTRRCNLNCEYCKIPKLGSKKELDTKEIMNVISHVKKHINPELLVLFGGEPFLRKDIYDIIRDCDIVDQKYCVISNSTIPVEFSQLSNYTASIDYIKPKSFKDKGIKEKSVCGLKQLLKAKKAGVKDVVGNIIITSDNVLYVPDLVKLLSSKGIWSIVGIVHSGKSDNWKFRTDCPGLAIDRYQAISISFKLFEMKKKGYLIHNNEEYLLKLSDYWNLSWHCVDFGLRYLIIDTDGSLIECNDTWGEMRKYNIYDIPDKFDEIEKAWKKTVSKCPGCFYNHMLQVCYEGQLIH